VGTVRISIISTCLYHAPVPAIGECVSIPPCSVAVAGADYAVDQGFEIGAWAKDQIFGEQLGITEPEDIKAFERARFTFMPEYLQGSKLVPIEIDESTNLHWKDYEGWEEIYLNADS